MSLSSKIPFVSISNLTRDINCCEAAIEALNQKPGQEYRKLLFCLLILCIAFSLIQFQRINTDTRTGIHDGAGRSAVTISLVSSCTTESTFE